MADFGRIADPQVAPEAVRQVLAVSGMAAFGIEGVMAAVAGTGGANSSDRPTCRRWAPLGHAENRPFFHSQQRLNQRPKKTLDFETPADKLQLVLRRSVEPAAQVRPFHTIFPAR